MHTHLVIVFYKCWAAWLTTFLVLRICQTTLAEQHVEHICGLESALRQRESSVQKLNAQLRGKGTLQSQLHTSLDVPRGGFCSDSQ